ncbi:hypothetical protein RUM44_003721 [Polyplax serrata]|uniref:Uncharacterized protein n=1 Tax=Polyplax serrata TaxID=468196 RepID=A0ABR1AHF0_POLSC
MNGGHMLFGGETSQKMDLEALLRTIRAGIEGDERFLSLKCRHLQQLDSVRDIEEEEEGAAQGLDLNKARKRVSVSTREDFFSSVFGMPAIKYPNDV